MKTGHLRGNNEDYKRALKRTNRPKKVFLGIFRRVKVLPFKKA